MEANASLHTKSGDALGWRPALWARHSIASPASNLGGMVIELLDG